MAIEQKWPSVAPQAFLANGTQFGVITIANTAGFKVKQTVVVGGTALPNLLVQVKRVLSRNQMIVGQPNTPLNNKTDLTLYTVASGSYVYAEEQDKTKLKPDDIWQAIYDQEPTVALRNVLVDQYGNYYDSVVGVDGLNRLAVDAAVTVTGIDVDLDALTPPTRPDPDNVLIAGSEDGTKTGVKHAIRSTDNGTIQTIQIFKKHFDAITATYPSPTQEIYQSKVGGIAGTVQETVTVNYTDATKNFILNVAVV